MEEEFTTLSIKKTTWVRLNQIKSYPSQTFDTIINSLIDYKQFNVKEVHSNDNAKTENPMESVDSKEIY